jgi:hypothetical protein
MTSGVAGPDEFREWMAPIVEVLRDLAASVDAVGDGHPNPAADSVAMIELSREHEFARPDRWQNPVSDTHMLGGATLRAAADYVRSFAELFTAQRPPMYGHLVLARSALEASAVAWWLNESGVGAAERAKRGLSEFLYSATEEAWLEIVPRAAQNVEEWVAWAASLDWAATDYGGRPWSIQRRGKPRVDGVGRPSTSRAMTRLLVSDEASQIGNLQWSRLSAVSHVTWFGLRWALMLDDSAANPATGLMTVPVGTDSGAVSVQALCILRALRVAATVRFTLMGRLNPDWDAAARRAMELERVLLLAYHGPHASGD